MTCMSATLDQTNVLESGVESYTTLRGTGRKARCCGSHGLLERYHCKLLPMQGSSAHCQAEKPLGEKCSSGLGSTPQQTNKIRFRAIAQSPISASAPTGMEQTEKQTRGARTGRDHYAANLFPSEANAQHSFAARARHSTVANAVAGGAGARLYPNVAKPHCQSPASVNPCAHVRQGRRLWLNHSGTQAAETGRHSSKKDAGTFRGQLQENDHSKQFLTQVHGRTLQRCTCKALRW